jgi:hypothetical protein
MQKQKPIRTTLYLPPELWKQCRLEAVKHNTTATEIVVRAVEAYLAGMKSAESSVAAKMAKDAGKKAAKAEAIEAQQKQFMEAVKGLHRQTKGGRP